MQIYPLNKPINLLSTRFTYQKILAFSLPLLMILLLSNTCQAENTAHTFTLLDQPDGSTTYKLTITITQTLYEYYLNKEHQLYSNYNLSRFVTPNPLEPVASDLWNIYNNEEDFVNGVLMITHQIPYKESGPQKYPIETLVENEGDCDLFSFLAASIIKAGGIDVVLLVYEEAEHMMVGVNLSQEPADARINACYFTHEMKQYYVAECTGNFEGGWRVGECPDSVQGTQALIIPMDNMELSSPDKVSSSYDTPQQSLLALSASSNLVLAENEIQIMGSLSPAFEGENVTLYISSFSSTLTNLATVSTDSNGCFSYTWHSPPGGVYYIRANWSGNSDYAGADSNTSRLIIIPFIWLLMGGIVIFSLIVLVVLNITTKSIGTQEVDVNEDWEFTEF
jgi:hypothetical protein